MLKGSYLSVSILLFAIAACSRPSNIVITETVSLVIPTTQLPTIQILATDTATAPQATITSTDTPMLFTTQPPSPTETTTPVSGTIAGEHRIAPGETLSCIGRGYGVLPNAIADENGIALTSILRVGQVLKIPRVQWTNIPAGPVCATQFTAPFPGLPVTGPFTLRPPPTPIDTNLPFPATATLPLATSCPTSTPPRGPIPATDPPPC